MNNKFTLLLCSLLYGLTSFAQPRFVTLDNTKIWINTIGLENRIEGQPVLVFESGYGTPMDHWDQILEGASALAPVITYDRPGIGKSEPDGIDPSIKNVSDRLIKLLKLLDVAPPYVLVGHSLGGMYVRGFANYYPDELAGLIIIDPADFTETQENKRAYYDFLNKTAAEVDELVAQVEQKLANRNAKSPAALQAEGKVLAAQRASDFAEIYAKPLPNIPVHLVIAGRFDYPKHLWSKDYDEEAVYRSKMKHRIARWIEVVNSVEKGMFLYSGDSGHFVHYEDPDLVIASIGIVLKDYERLKGKKK